MNEQLAARFNRETSKSIMSLIGEVEGGHLDCKEVSDPKMSTRDSKRLLASILSAFANSEGGLILWGVTAKKNPDQIDCVTAFPGVREPDVFVSRLRELTSEALSPGLAGIDHRIINDDPSAPVFVITVVPASDAGPHMAKLGEHRYHQRIGQSTLHMEHFQLADMFGRRPQAALSLRFYPELANLCLCVDMTNIGRGIATAPYLLFFDILHPYIVSPYPRTGSVADFPLPKIPPTSRQGVDGFVGGLEHLIHPNLHLTFRCLQVPNTWSGSPPPTICSASFRYGAAGVTEGRGKLVCDLSAGTLEIEGAT
jgi:hypothetical protein